MSATMPGQYSTSDLRWVATFIRATAILAVAFVAACGYAALRLRALLLRGRDRRAQAVARARGRMLRWAMERLGATFIKLGQVMSSRPDLFSRPLIDELRRLQDALPAFAGWRARAEIEAAIGAPIDETFTEFDDHPIAAASVAQVHRARLKSGRECAIKVLRPNVRRQIDRDRAVLLAMARVMSLSRTLRLSDPVGHLTELMLGIQNQTDLRLEIANYAKFRDNFRDTPGVRFPEVFADLCGERVLTMELLSGVKIDELPPGDYKKLGAGLSQLFLKMCFEDGFVHSDLHPGNLLIDDQQRIAVFDVGLAKQLDDRTTEMFLDFTRCVAMGDASDFVSHFKKFHGYMVDTDWDALTSDADAFVAKFRGRQNSELELGQMANDIFTLARRYRIQPEPELTLVLVAMLTAEGISKMLSPDVDTFRDTAALLGPILQKRAVRSL